MKPTEAPRPEHKTAEDFLADLRAHLTDLDNEEERIRKERQRCRAAITALEPRRKPGRPAKTTA